MEQRYIFYDTQIIDPSIDPLKSRELLNLEGLDVLAKIPTTNGVSLFYRDSFGHIVYGNFILKENETYEGKTYNISGDVSFSENDVIFIKNGFYNQDGSYYVFYNNNNNIFLRTFLTRRGIIGDEILVQENASILKLERIKENFFIIFKDLTHKEIFDKLEELNEGEIKILFLYENDIDRYEGKYERILKTQVIENPFNDIGIEKWSCVNKVNNNKGFLYFKGDVELTENSNSINGYCFRTNSYCLMEMNKESQDYTLTIRGYWVANSKKRIETNNIKVEYIGDEIVVTYPDGTIQKQQFVFPYDEDTFIWHFVNFTLTSSLVYGKRLYQLYFSSGYNNQEVIFQYVVNQDQLQGYQNDSFLKIDNYWQYDYISLQNFSQTKNAIKDIHNAFERKLVANGHNKTRLLTGDFVNNYINETVKQYRRTTYLTLPSDVILVEYDYETSKYDDLNKTFWICPNTTLELNGTENLTIFMESNSIVINKGSKKAKIYAKSGSVINLDNAKNFELIYEEGVIITNVNESTFLKKEESIAFNYHNVSQEGCKENEDAPTIKTLEFPFFPSDKQISKLTTICVSEATGEGRFKDNGDGTISDLAHGLMWLKTPVIIPQDKTNKQNQAYNFAKKSTFSDYTNWRLPTVGEMTTLDGVIDIQSTCISGFDCTTETVPASSMLPPTSAGPVEGFIDVETCVVNLCKEGTPYILVEDGPFDFSTYIDNFENNVTIWTTDSINEGSNTGSGEFYSYDLSTHNVSLVNATEGEFGMGLLVRSIDTKLKVLYDDGVVLELPTIKGEVVSLVKDGFVRLIRSGIGALYDGYNVLINYTENIEEIKNMKYTNHYNLNSANKYFFGTYLPVNRVSKNEELRNTVLPIFLDQTTNIPNTIFTNPEENIRVCENIRQRCDLTPFIINHNSNSLGVTVWIPFTRINEQIGIQYSIKEDFLMNPVFSSYDVLSAQTYPLDSYYCVYHFDELHNVRKLLIKDIILEVAGEIILGGITSKNTYLREIKAINFFSKPQKYKTAEFNVLIDAQEISDRESYINNYNEIRNFIKMVVEKWKPATANINRIIEDKTLIMAELLKDEYTQVLVGITSRQNSNAYYIRSVDTGNLSVVSSSNKFSDEVDWIGVGRINTPYIKTGVTKIKKSVKRIKIPFETRYDTSEYRTFVFCPKNEKYYVVNKDREGFIVESSYLVEQEVAWITLNTKQAINGTINWRRAIPEGELIANNIDRIDEVNEHSNRYIIKFLDFGFSDFIDTNYSVILSSNQNINVWVESKTPSQFIVRRSYAGVDVEIDFMVVEGNSKWWKQITA